MFVDPIRLEDVIVIQEINTDLFQPAILGADGIVYARISDSITLNEQTVGQIIDEMSFLNKDRIFPWIIELKEISEIHHRGIATFFNNQFRNKFFLIAFVVGHEQVKVSSSFLSYLELLETVTGEEVNIKLFINQEEAYHTARKWIIQKKKKSLLLKLQRLDDQKIKILAGVLKNKTNQKIATALKLSKSTVDRERSNLFKFLETENYFLISQHLNNIAYAKKIVNEFPGE